MRVLRCVVATLFICFAVLPLHAPAQDSPARVTILYDAFGKAAALRHGWGYSALVEYGGRRILFDTGANLDDFAANVNSLGVDLGRLDFVVLTHRHGDHTSGLHHVLKVNPGMQIYTPVEPANFDTPVPPALANLIRRRVDSAPEDMHYYDGKYPQRIASGSPWPGAKFAQIRTPTEVLPGFWLFSTLSEVTGTKEMNEISMAVRTPQGLALKYISQASVEPYAIKRRHLFLERAFKYYLDPKTKGKIIG